MAETFRLQFLLVWKLASLAAHAEDFLSLDGCQRDLDAIATLLTDPEVRGFLDDPRFKVLLPYNRKAKTP